MRKNVIDRPKDSLLENRYLSKFLSLSLCRYEFYEVRIEAFLAWFAFSPCLPRRWLLDYRYLSPHLFGLTQLVSGEREP